MPQKTDLHALTERCEEKRVHAKQQETPPVPVPMSDDPPVRKRKRIRKTIRIQQKHQEDDDDLEFQSDVDDDSQSIELVMAFREADMLRSELSFWKNKVQQIAPDRVEEFETEFYSQPPEQPCIISSKNKRIEPNKSLSTIKITETFQQMRDMIVPANFVYRKIIKD